MRVDVVTVTGARGGLDAAVAGGAVGSGAARGGANDAMLDCELVRDRLGRARDVADVPVRVDAVVADTDAGVAGAGRGAGDGVRACEARRGARRSISSSSASIRRKDSARLALDSRSDDVICRL